MRGPAAGMAQDPGPSSVSATRPWAAAEHVGTKDAAAVRLRQALTRLGLAEVRGLLEAGEPGRAAEGVTQLRNRSVESSELQTLEEAAKGWTLAKEQAGCGEFAQAV